MTDEPDDPPDLTQLAKLSELFAASYTLARQAYERDHGTIIAADASWQVATVGEDGQVAYLAVLGFIISAERIHMALTAERYPIRYSALVDPSTGRHVSTHDGKVYADGETFQAAMQALRKFMAEAPEVGREVAH